MQTEIPVKVSSTDTLMSWMISWLSREFKVEPESIRPDQAFLSLGMDSVQGMTMIGELELELNQTLPPTLVWDYPTIGELAEHLAELTTDRGPMESGKSPDGRPGDANPNPTDYVRRLGGAALDWITGRAAAGRE